MIDRDARNKAIAAFRDYLDDRISAFVFDERLDEIDSKDKTVRQVTWLAWHLYDDVKDHPVVLSKEGWDFLQRLLLILESDAELAVTTKKFWSWDHALACMATVIFVMAGIGIGWGPQLLLMALPFGGLSLWIQARRNRQITSIMSLKETACQPFHSYTQMRKLLRRTPQFKKLRYRKELAGRSIRSEAGGFLVRAFSHLVSLIAGPLCLLGQSFPSSMGYSYHLSWPDGKNQQITS